MTSARAGFTLVESLVALAISSLVLVLVSTVFLVQNEYFSVQTQRAGLQDNARSVMEVMAGEIRSLLPGGVVIAEADSVTVRSPMRLSLVCAESGSHSHVQMQGGADGVDHDEVAGFAVLDPGDTSWDYYYDTWNNIDDEKPEEAIDRCVGNGADTSGISDEFIRFKNLDDQHDSVPPVGALLVLFRETTYAFRTSQLDPTQRALFRRAYGSSPVEYATGIDTTAAFQYHHTGAAGYFDQLTGSARDSIDAIRITSRASLPSQVGGRDDLTYGWSVNVALRNVR